MGALPNKLPGGQDVERSDRARASSSAPGGGAKIPTRKGWHLSQMFEAMEHGKLKSLYVLGENPAQSEADQKRAMELLASHRPHRGAGHVPDEDGRDRARVLPAAASWCEDEAPVTSSERRVQRVREGARASGQARAIWRSSSLSASASAWTWAPTSPKSLGRAAHSLALARRDELSEARGARRASSGRARTSRIREARSCTDGCGRGRAKVRRRRSTSSSTTAGRQAFRGVPDALTTGRRLDSYNTGVQTAGYTSPLAAARRSTLRRRTGAAPCSRGRNGAGHLAPGRHRGRPSAYDATLRPGLAFMTLHFQDDVP
jgi:formate dehydrogenase major subunit